MGHPFTREHAQLCDLYLVQDLLLSSQLRVNLALVIDAAIAIAEQVAWRPGMLARDKFDAKNEFSVWQSLEPLTLGDVDIDPFGIDEVVTEGGHACTLKQDANARPLYCL